MPAFPLLGLLIGAAAGAGKHFAVDQPAANRQRKLAAETQRLSPWTGLKADKVEEPNLFGSMLQFGATGAGLEQSANTAASQQELMDKMAGFYDRGGDFGLGNRLSLGSPSLAALPAEVPGQNYFTGNKTLSPWRF